MSELDNYKVQLRRATSAQWTSANTVLKNAEPAIETDTGKFKVGDGITPWVLLPYSADEEEFISLIRDVGPAGGPFQFIGADVVMVDTLLSAILSTLALISNIVEDKIEWPDGPGSGGANLQGIPFVDTYSSGNTTVIATGYPTGIYCYDVSVGKTINLSTPDIKYVGLVWSIISSDQNSGDITVPGVMGETLSIAPGYIVQIVGFWRDDIEAPAWRVLAGWPITSDFVAS
jgi:hypothetical protein